MRQVLLGAAIVLVVVYLWGRMKRGTVSTPLMGTRIDLNPALYQYNSSSSLQGVAY